ncbi:MAG: hypothetical protein QOG50_2419 [Actinomycetota bacterium]|nr:hypothetical protein [Actinomycetota bacterium]
MHSDVHEADVHEGRLNRIILLSVVTIGLLAIPPAAATSTKGTHTRRDTVPPIVTIGTPTAGALVGGSVTVAGTASDAGGVASVSVSIDSGSYRPAGGTASWTYALDATSLSNANHTITSKATDLAGNSSTSSVTVVVSNTTVDATAPTVSITTPQNGATATAGAVSVAGNAGDNVGVATVSIAVDGGVPTLATGTTSWTVVISSLGAGSHSINARASDAAGNVGTATVTVNVTATVPPGTGPDVVVTDPAATGSIDPVLRTRLLQRGDLTGFVYLDQTGNRPSVYFRDAVTRAASIVALPADSQKGWTYMAGAMPSDTDLWLVGGSGPLTLRHYTLGRSGLPTSATLVETRTFGDTDSRPGDLIALADGSLVVAWHQQGSTGPEGQFVAFRNAGGAWSQLAPLTFMSTRASNQVLAQHPSDGSVWLFSNPDGWASVGAAHLSEQGGTLVVDWTNGFLLTHEVYGQYGPDPEHPDLAAAADPATGTIALAYQSYDRQIFFTSTGNDAGSRVAVARFPATGAPSFIAEPDYAERVADVGLVVEGADTVVTYQPLDPTTLDYSSTYARAYANGTWQPAILLGDGNGVAYASGRTEFVVKLADGRIHLLTL